MRICICISFAAAAAAAAVAAIPSSLLTRARSAKIIPMRRWVFIFVNIVVDSKCVL